MLKNILIKGCLACILYCYCIYCQGQFPLHLLSAKAKPANNIVQVKSIEELSAITDSAVLILLTDPLSGGFFSFNKDSMTDGGTTFRATAIGKGSWKRIFETSAGIYVTWYGARGDGKSNDATAIQKAIMSSTLYKTSVELPAGTYYIPGNSTISLPGHIHLKGAGKDFTIIKTDSAFYKDFPTLIRTTGDDISIEDITFSGGRPVNSSHRSAALAGRYSLLNISFDVEPTKNISIERCRFSDAYGRALIYKASNVLIRECEFLRTGRYNINFEAIDGAISNFGRTGCENVTIHSNYFENIGTHAISSYRINHLRVFNNQFKYISGIAIANQECMNVQASDNTIEECGDNGIDVQRCKNVSITGNNFYCSGNKNAGNAGSAAAIFCGDDYGTGQSDNIVIERNFIEGTYTGDSTHQITKSYQNCGIYIIDATHVKILNNLIRHIGATGYFQTLQSPSLEDGNGIMIVNTQKGKASDIIIQSNTLGNIKCNGIYINGQSREIKITDNYIDSFGVHGLMMHANGTNLFGMIDNNTILDGRNVFALQIAADIFVEVQDGWITNLKITGNHLRNNQRNGFDSINARVNTTHGIYFNAKGFGRFNNIMVADNQMQGHSKDEIGFSTTVSEYYIQKFNSTPVWGFVHNYSGSTDDQPEVIVPGINQDKKPEIISESYGDHAPSFGNYSKGSVIKNTNPANNILRWIVMNSGIATDTKWVPNMNVYQPLVVFNGEYAFKCLKQGVTGNKALHPSDNIIKDGTTEWVYLGIKVFFKPVLFPPDTRIEELP